MMLLIVSAFAAALQFTFVSPPAMAGDQTWNVRPGGVAISASTPMPTCHVSEPLARTLISANGYFGIKNMTQDISGMWRGTAIRYGYAQAVGFELDGDGRFALVGK